MTAQHLQRPYRERVADQIRQAERLKAGRLAKKLTPLVVTQQVSALLGEPLTTERYASFESAIRYIPADVAHALTQALELDPKALWLPEHDTPPAPPAPPQLLSAEFPMDMDPPLLPALNAFRMARYAMLYASSEASDKPEVDARYTQAAIALAELIGLAVRDALGEPFECLEG